MKALKRPPKLADEARERVHNMLVDTEQEIVSADSDYLRFKMLGYCCLALNELYGMASVRLSRPIKCVGDKCQEMALWAHDLGDDEKMYDELRAIGLDALADAIEDTRKQREKKLEELMTDLGGGKDD